MNIVLILFIMLTTVLPAVTYLVTDNIISTILVLIFLGLYLFLYAYPKLKKMSKNTKGFHSCYTFINTFIVSLSIKGSLPASFESTRLLMDDEYRLLVDGLDNLAEEEKLDYLKKYYSFDVYLLFLKAIKIWVEEGGDILSFTHYLIEESRRKEDYLIKCENISRRKIIDFSMLWMFTYFILFILRFALNSFYSLTTRNLLFQIAVIALVLLLLLSIHVLIVKLSNTMNMGYKYE